MTHLLVVEDDETIGRLLQSTLRSQGHEVTWQRTGHSAVQQAAHITADLVLLDLGLPDLDGVEVCRRLRAVCPDGVIVMLTARDQEMDVIVGLEAGADDYLTKPFRLIELLARVRAHLRRAAPDAQPKPPVVVGGLVVDGAARRAMLGGREVVLRAREFDLLARLAAEPDVAVSRQTLMADVWDEHWFGSTKTLDVHIAAVRRKLEEVAVADAPRIVTLRGYGYRLETSV